MKNMPQIIVLADGSRLWENTFEHFKVMVYLPMSDYMTDVINYSFNAPYLLILVEEKLDAKQAVCFAQERSLDVIAKEYGASVVFVYPTNENGWENATEELYIELISESKISQYYKDGVAIMRDRFTGEWGDVYIRGMRARTFLYGYGAAADYIAKYCLKTIEGEGLYGPGDITPTVCYLENLSVIPKPKRRDIPVVSVGNTDEINTALRAGLDHILVKEQADYIEDFYGFISRYRRMVGELDIEPDLDAMGMETEPGYCVVLTSSDNCGDDRDKKEHLLGYVAYYNRAIMSSGKKVPLVLCFHGGGDSAMTIVSLAEWHRVANRHEFLLVSVENHMNSTATEAVSLIEHLKETYAIDEERIYATGFSMGGCKTWDLFQEYPDLFAAVAPMDATFEVGLNVFGKPVEEINQETILPVFYVGGEETPLPELPSQAEKCLERMLYTLGVNQAKVQPALSFDNKEAWTNPFYGINGDYIRKEKDEKTGSVLTMHLFESNNGCCYCVFGSASKQKHEMRHLNSENAWKFMSCFRRLANGDVIGGKIEEIASLYSE